jgi:hypothetical protein
MSTEFSRLPSDLPVPVDDGAADHLPGAAVPDVALPSTQGGELSPSDHELVLAERMRLPTFEAGGLRLYRRLTFVAEHCRMVKLFYPVFPPDRNADEVLAWLQERAD